MTVTGTDLPPSRRADGPAPRPSHLPLVIITLSAFLAARALDLVFFLYEAGSFPGTTLSTELNAWDGGWYRRIVQNGYPDHVLLYTRAGRIEHSSYAFFPAYPYLVRWLSEVSHLGFTVVAPLLSLVLGAAAAVCVALAVRPYLDSATAITTSVFWSFLPTAPLLMMAYTEGLFTLEMALFFILLRRRNYLLLAPLVVAAGLTRGTGLPLAVVLLTHLIVRWREAAGTGRRLRAIFAPVVLLLVSGVSIAAWPAYVGRRDGHWNAYLKVQDAWINGRTFHPSWWHVVAYLHGHYLLPGTHLRFISSWLVIGVAIAVLLTCLLILRTRLSPELKTFGLAFLIFVVAVTPIWTAFFRYLLPVFTLPAGWAIAARWRWSRVLIVLVLAVLQCWWIHLFVAGFPKSYASP